MPNDIWTIAEPNYIWTAPEVNYIWTIPEPELELDCDYCDSQLEDSTDVDEFNDSEEICDCEFCKSDRVSDELDDVKDKLDDAQAKIIRLTLEKSDLTGKLCNTALNLQTAQSTIQQRDSRITSILHVCGKNEEAEKIARDVADSLARTIAVMEVQKNYLNLAWGGNPYSDYTGIDINLFGLWLSIRFNPLTLLPKIKFGCL